MTELSGTSGVGIETGGDGAVIPDDAHRVALERALLERRAAARVPASPAPAVTAPSVVLAPDVSGVAPAAVAAGEDAALLVTTLRRELDARAQAAAGLRSRLIDAETRLAARVLLEQRTTVALTQVRGEVERLRGAVERDRGARAAVALEPARLNDALSRLRETIPSQEAPVADAASAPDGLASAPLPPSRAAASPPPEGASASPAPEVRAGPSLEPVFRRLVRRDPDAAGRLLLELLPLQGVAYPHPVAYDLVLGAGSGRARPTVSVTVRDRSAAIAIRGTPRPGPEVDLHVVGEPGRIARLLVAGWLRRRFGFGVARVRGRREKLAALSALLRTPADLLALQRAAIRLDSATAFALVGAMIDPAWTAGHRFTLAHEQPETATTYVLVRAGRPIEVMRTAPTAPIDTTLRCRADQLLAALSGATAGRPTVAGDEMPLALLCGWIKRAQSV